MHFREYNPSEIMRESNSGNYWSGQGVASKWQEGWRWEGCETGLYRRGMKAIWRAGTCGFLEANGKQSHRETHESEYSARFSE